MLNKTSTFLNRGVINQTIIVDPKIDPVLKIIKKDFYSGKIVSALSSLQDLINDYSDRENIVFQLLKLKAHFLLSLYKTEDYLKLIELLERYSKYEDNDYKQLKLSYYMIKLDTNNYFKTANELSITTGKQKEFFDLQYYTNTDADKAIEVYKKYFLENDTPEVLFFAAFAYLKNNSSFNLLDKDNNYYKHLELYKRCIDKIEFDNAIERLHYLTNASNIPIGFKLNKIVDDQCPKNISLIDEFIGIVEHFGDNINQFENGYIKHVINQYLLALVLKDNKSQFNNTALSYHSILSTENFLQYHFFNDDLNDELVLKKFRITSDYSLIELYLRSLYENDKNHAIDFVVKNNIYNSDHILSFEFYFLAEIFIHKELPAEYLQHINKHKDDSINNLCLYLKIFLALKKEIHNDDIDKLYESSNDINASYHHIYECIEIFFYAKHWSKIFQLSLNKKDIYPQIVKDTFNFCMNPNITLSMHDFERYINLLSDKKEDHSRSIGLIYHNFQSFGKAFEFYNISWNKERTIPLAANLFTVLIAVKQMRDLNSYEEKVLEECVAFLESDNKFDNFNITLHIAHYYIKKKDFSKGFKLFNRAILKRELNGFNQEEIDAVASFFNIQSNRYKYIDDTFNIFINSENKNFIYDGYTLSDSVKELFNFELCNDLKLKMLRKEELQKSQGSTELPEGIKCLSSLIIFYFLPKSSYTTSFTIDESFKNDPLSFLDNILKPYNDQREESLKNLSDEKIIPFFQIESDFLKFPDLIKILKERSDLIFFSGYNIQEKNLPKLLTITSIFFLDSIGYFTDFISEQLDIYIQQSVFKFFFDRFEERNEFGHLIKPLQDFYEAKRIIDDSKASPLFISLIKLRELFGIFDYNAICLGLSNKVQLVSEDPSLLKFFGNIEGIVLPTNSSFLIFRFLSKENNLNNAITKVLTDLHAYNYKYILPFEIIQQLRFFSKNKDLIKVEPLSTLLKIAEDYSWLSDEGFSESN